MEESKMNSYLSKLKAKSVSQEVYGGKTEEKCAEIKIKDCPNCGAGRAQQDGITHCAYCGFEFIANKLTNGINLKESDNSRENKR